MSYFSIDVESDGPIPRIYSMVNFGCVVVEPTLLKTFYGETRPISPIWQKEALAISGFSRTEHSSFELPQVTMKRFDEWITKNSIGDPILISDNPAFDWQFINYYFHFFLGHNPFGFSARRIGDLYCGMKKDIGLNKEWKKLLRKTSHDHNPVNDAKGNAEAILAMQEMGLKIKLV